MTAAHVTQPRVLAALITRLETLGVDLPAEVTAAAALLEDAATGVLTRQASIPANAEHLLGMTREQVLAHIRATALLTLATDALAQASVTTAQDIAAAAGRRLTTTADTILEQLRPRFDAAAQPVHDAAALGIRPTTTAADVLDLGAKAIAAWRSLPAHTAVLEEIGQVRVAMCDVLDVAPAVDPFGPRQYGAAFSPDAPQWERPAGHSGETDTAKWLRLSQRRPLTLLSIAATKQAAAAGRVIPTCTVVAADGGPVNGPLLFVGR